MIGLQYRKQGLSYKKQSYENNQAYYWSNFITRILFISEITIFMVINKFKTTTIDRKVHNCVVIVIFNIEINFFCYVTSNYLPTHVSNVSGSSHTGMVGSSFAQFAFVQAEKK